MRRRSPARSRYPCRAASACCEGRSQMPGGRNSFSFAAPRPSVFSPSSSSASKSDSRCSSVRPCVSVWLPTSWPSARMRLTMSGCWRARRPTRKNVAFAFSRAQQVQDPRRVDRIGAVVEGERDDRPRRVDLPHDRGRDAGDELHHERRLQREGGQDAEHGQHQDAGGAAGRAGAGGAIRLLALEPGDALDQRARALQRDALQVEREPAQAARAPRRRRPGRGRRGRAGAGRCPGPGEASAIFALPMNTRP